MGGAERHAVNLANNLDRRRFEPAIVCLGADPALLKDVASDVRVRCVGPRVGSKRGQLEWRRPMHTRILAILRHPIYAGLVLVLAGYTLAWSNWTLALGVALLSQQYFEAKARAEERWLIERYLSYQSYMMHVRRRDI